MGQCGQSLRKLGVIKVINRLTRELFTAMVECRPACVRSSPWSDGCHGSQVVVASTLVHCLF